MYLFEQQHERIFSPRLTKFYSFLPVFRYNYLREDQDTMALFACFPQDLRQKIEFTTSADQCLTLVHSIRQSGRFL